MTTDERSAARGRRDLLAAAALWSLSGVIAKGLHLDSGAIAFYRSMFGGLALLCLVRPRAWVVRPVMIPLALFFGAMIGLYLAAVKLTTAANAIFLQCSATFWVVPLSLIFLKERPDRRSILGISSAMLGVVSIVGFGHEGTIGETRGIVLGVGSGVCFAVVLIGMRGLRALDPTWLSAFNNLGGALAIGAWLVVSTGGIPIPTAGQSLVLIAFGIVQMAIPYALFARGLHHVGAAEAGLIGLLEPVLNPIWVALVHGETPARATIVGGAFLLGGVAIRYLPTRASAAEPARVD